MAAVSSWAAAFSRPRLTKVPAVALCDRSLFNAALQAVMATAIWRSVRFCLPAAMAHSWTGLRPAEITELAWAGIEAIRAAVAAAAKIDFMFHSPGCGPSSAESDRTRRYHSGA